MVDLFAGKETRYWYSYSLSSTYKVPWYDLSDLECRLTFPDILSAIQFIREVEILRGRQ